MSNNFLDDKQLKKSVAAIQSKPSKDVHLVQRKLINICLYHAYNDLSKNMTHKIHIDTLHLYFGYEGNNWKVFDDAFKELQEITFTFDIFGNCTNADEKISFKRVPFFASVEWNKDTREFGYKFGEEIGEKFYLPEQFATLALKVQSKFKSSHSLVLYEQCLRYVTNLHGSRWFTIQDLRDIFGTGKRYTEFKDFNKWVLKPAIEEINAVSDIEIEAEYKKSGRSVTNLKFNVCYKNITLSLPSEELEKKEVLYNILIASEFGVEQQVVETLFANYSLKVIENAVEYVRNTAAYKNKKGNIAGYVVKAIREGYQTKERATLKNINEKNKKDILQQAINSIKEKINKKYKERVNKVVTNFLSQKDENEVIEMKEFFCKTNPQLIEEANKVISLLKKHHDVFEAPGIKPLFYNYLIQNIESLKKEVGTVQDLAEELSAEEKILWERSL